MGRMPRVNIEGALYYVTARGDRNENIFLDEADFNAYKGLLKKYKQQSGFKLFAFTLLPNAIHLLFELKEGVSISNVMHDLNSNYTKYFNSRHSLKGHLFQERYRLVLAEKAIYLAGLSGYVHSLAQESGMRTKEFSSSFVIYKEEAPEVGSFDLSPEAAELRQSAALFPPLNAENEKKVFEQELRSSVVLGSDEFKIKVKEEMENKKISALKNEASPSASGMFTKAGIIVILILAALAGVLYNADLRMKTDLRRQMAEKEKAMQLRLAKERADIAKDLDSKYMADMVSFQAMSKRLEIEKEKIKVLESGKK